MKLQLIYNVLSMIFLLWMCSRWSTNKFQDSMIKVFLFLISLVGILLILKELKLI